MNEKQARPSGSVAQGAALMMLLKMVERSIGLISTLILARVLTPADFGLVAMAMSVVGLTELMGAFGFDVAIIQNQNAERKHYDTAWTLNVLFGIVTACVLVALSYGAALFYKEPRLLYMLPALAIGALIGGLENIGTVNFRKEMDFKKEFRFLFFKRVATFVITISMALVFRSYWALIIGIVSGKVFSVAISYLLHGYRPRFSLAASAEFFHFSKWLFLSNLVLFIQHKCDSFVLGRSIGARDLGLYNVSAEIAAMPSTELIAPINRAVFPAYSKLSVDLAALRVKFHTVFGLITVVCLPIALGLVCVADLVVSVMLGEQWKDSVPLIRIFAASGLASAIQSNLILVIVACGQPKLNTVRNALMLVLYLPALVVGSIYYGAYGAAWVHFTMSIIALIPLHFVFLHIVEMRFTEYCADIWRPTIAALAMAIAVAVSRYFSNSAFDGLAPLLQLLIFGLEGAFIYSVILVALWRVAGGNPTATEATILNMVAARTRLQFLGQLGRGKV